MVDYEISINQQFQIELKSNPSTGYLWSWTNKQNVSTVDTTGHIFISDNPELVGSGGKEIWKFIGIKSGIDTLVFKYFRPWEADNVVEIKKIVVRVR